ncbi:ABC transporter permease [Naumannella halotolerans]|uniref:Oligopeptide transport system permease protein n=1 Tax=Naumannella halotolerans TaxID=993414 RepID=A0A4R7J8H0_9ACTN|nr:ABC transporter permease [Naumannella halotolerans]TDT32659.1 oligopeptide transport system permease protein [Naumannella halotolerans]
MTDQQSAFITPGEATTAAAAGGRVTERAPQEQPEKKPAKGRSLWSDAWREMRSNPMFWISSSLILVVIVMAAFPQLFASGDPNYANLTIARQPPSAEHWFGTDRQGYDVYTRTIYGARASIMVGLGATLGVVLIGGLVGLISGYVGGWLDSLLSRLGEIFLAIPLLLAGILFLYIFPAEPGESFYVIIGKVILVIVLFGWPTTARLMRSAVLQVKPNDYVTAARALGGSPARIVFSHVLPNSLAPIMVVATINLGVYIAAEATLSFLGIGLKPPAVSWGLSISDAATLGMIREAPHMLIYPSLFLSVTVLAFIMLGDAVRDALDPKLR